MLKSVEHFSVAYPSLFNDEIENPAYLSTQIITYLGNKRSLFGFLEPAFEMVKAELGKDKLHFLDVFSGSGIVSRFARKHSSVIFANDLEKYSHIINQCYLHNYSLELYNELKSHLRVLEHDVEQNFEAGFIAELYAPADDENVKQGDRAFYTRRNAIYLDSAVKAIAKAPYELQKFFLAPLLAGASVHSNTSGVFKGFYKNTDGIGQFGGQGKHALNRITADIKLKMPIFSDINCESVVLQSDANQLMQTMEHVDIAYFDPPYNQHPYGSNYFMLNLLCNYARPNEISKVSGIPANWNRSDYNKPQLAEEVLFDAVTNCKADFLLISYNSEGFISHETFLQNLNQCGKVRVMDKAYNTFRGCRNLSGRSLYVTEYLYLVDKR